MAVQVRVTEDVIDTFDTGTQWTISHGEINVYDATGDVVGSFADGGWISVAKVVTTAVDFGEHG